MTRRIEPWRKYPIVERKQYGRVVEVFELTDIGKAEFDKLCDALGSYDEACKVYFSGKRNA